MSELIKYIRNLIGIASSERDYLQDRKRRLINEDNENYTAKFPRLNEKMSRNGFHDWEDAPSTSRNSFLRYPVRRPNIRSLHIPPEVINLCDDDDDIVEISSSKKSVLGLLNGTSSGRASKLHKSSPSIVIKEAKKSINNCNRYLNNGGVNDSIRLDEQQLYHDMLLNSPRTAAVYGTSTPARRTFDYSEGARARKILSAVNEKKCPLIDLTDEKSTKSSSDLVVIKDSSDSEADTVVSKRKVKPVNSFQIILDTEPFMRPDYLLKLDKHRKQQKKEAERLINEERQKRDKFSDITRENINLLLEEKLKNCKITEVVLLDEGPEEEELNFPEFSPEQDTKISEALKCRNNRVFVEKFNLRITGQDLKLFNEKEWLNDEVINFYVNLIQERSRKSNMPKVHSFNTFFYPKLISSGYESLRRWTKRVDIFAVDLIVVPVHLGFHWCMAIIDFRNKSIRYYDSMLGKNTQCLTALENYLREEHRDKKKFEFDTSEWQKVIMKEIPRQMNGSDCGVFSCTFAEFITRNAKIVFSQQHMPYIRRKMVIEIIEGRLLT